jgi:hypothetical protein
VIIFRFAASYRHALASELERQGIRLKRQNNTFRVAAILRNIERAFSKRRRAIEEAARIHGHGTPEGMELRHFESGTPVLSFLRPFVGLARTQLTMR